MDEYIGPYSPEWYDENLQESETFQQAAAQYYPANAQPSNTQASPTPQPSNMWATLLGGLLSPTTAPNYSINLPQQQQTPPTNYTPLIIAVVILVGIIIYKQNKQ